MSKPTRTTVHISNLRVPCCIGVTKEERSFPQTISVDMSFTLTNPIVGHGDLKTTVDYAEAAEYARTLGREHVFVLIEEFAEQVALVCLVMFPQVCEVIVTVRKPKILPDAEEAGVRRSFER